MTRLEELELELETLKAKHDYNVYLFRQIDLSIKRNSYSINNLQNANKLLKPKRNFLWASASETGQQISILKGQITKEKKK